MAAETEESLAALGSLVLRELLVQLIEVGLDDRSSPGMKPTRFCRQTYPPQRWGGKA